MMVLKVLIVLLIGYVLNQELFLHNIIKLIIMLMMTMMILKENSFFKLLINKKRK